MLVKFLKDKKKKKEEEEEKASKWSQKGSLW